MDEKGKLRKVLVCNPGSEAKNPAFDVTPAQLISGIITEEGIIKADAEGIAKLFS
jgi:methylthioribose-1-phosphate isomerase